MPVLTANTREDPDGRAVSSHAEMARLIEVIAALREHCPWTAALTHASLTTYLVEEAYEFLEAVETGHGAEMANELGDILLQVVLHARLAQEDGRFDMADVARGLADKMIRRSPHVFHSDGSLQDSFPATVTEIEATWDRVKVAERAAKAIIPDRTTAREPANPFAGIPRSLPALAMAQKSLQRAARAGVGPGEVPVSFGGPIETEAELGKVLFDVVRGAHYRGLDAERALRLAVREFQAAFPTVE